jgi:DNA-binding MarR family transcriptional regulator
MDSTASFNLILLLQEFGQASDRYVEATGSLHKTHRTEMNALALIMRLERAGTPPTPGEISRALQLSSPATSAMLGRLERRGHIERLQIDKDRRVQRIKLTPLALADGRAMFVPLAESMREVISHYSSAEVELISRFMAQATAGVDRAHGTGAED